VAADPRRPRGSAAVARWSGAVARWSAVPAVLLAAGCAFATYSQDPGRMRITSAALPKLGRIVVDDRGRTLYMFASDPPNRSGCFGACASIWPPATTSGRPEAAGGTRAGLLTTIARPDGPRQLVYAGHPLYYYQADTGRGDAHGQAITQFGAPWFAVTPGGQVQITTGSAHGGSRP
jgi:predicted lipoprotein with Yx(FWY)xxD motif